MIILGEHTVQMIIPKDNHSKKCFFKMINNIEKNAFLVQTQVGASSKNQIVLENLAKFSISILPKK